MHVEDPLGFVVRRALTVECGSRRRRRPLKKPLDWPRYMVVRRLSNGDVGILLDVATRGSARWVHDPGRGARVQLW